MRSTALSSALVSGFLAAILPTVSRADDADVEAAIKELRNVALLGDDGEPARQAIAKIKTLGKTCVPRLVVELKHDNVEVRLVTLIALSELGPEAAAAAPALTAGLNDKSLCEFMAFALTQIQPADEAGIVKVLREGTAHAKRAAAIALSGLQPPRDAAVPVLVAQLGHSAMPVREAAATALGKMWMVSTPASMEAMRHGDPQVRAAAIFSVGVVTSPERTIQVKGGRGLRAESAEHERDLIAMRKVKRESIPSLINALKDSNADVRIVAADTLRRLAILDDTVMIAAPALVALIDDEDPLVGESAQLALGRITGLPLVTRFAASETDGIAKESMKSSYLRELRDNLSADDKQTRLEAARKLSGQATDGSEVPVLAAFLSDADHVKRIQAAAALAHVKSRLPEAVAALTGGLRDGDPMVRGWCALALGSLNSGVESARDRLKQMAKDADLDVRACAKLALQRIDQAKETGKDRGKPNREIEFARDRKSLLRRLKSIDVATRRSAIEMLAEPTEANEETIAALVEALRDSDPQVRWIAAFAAGHLRSRGKPAVPALIEMLESDWSSYLSPNRGQAAASLGAIGPAAKEAVPALTKIAESNQGNVTRWAKRALKFINRPPEQLKVIELLDRLGGQYETDLGWIDLARSGVTDKDLKHLASIGDLQTLNLANTSISDDGMQHLLKCESLTTLDLSQSKITEKGLLELQRHKSLKRLRLIGMVIPDATLQKLRMSGLEVQTQPEHRDRKKDKAKG